MKATVAVCRRVMTEGHNETGQTPGWLLLQR